MVGVVRPALRRAFVLFGLCPSERGPLSIAPGPSAKGAVGKGGCPRGPGALSVRR